VSSLAGRLCAESETADLVLVAASRNVDDTLFGDTPSKLINNPSPHPSRVSFFYAVSKPRRLPFTLRQAHSNYALFRKVLEAIPQLVQFACKFTEYDFRTLYS
jgi:hypothetical protein